MKRHDGSEVNATVINRSRVFTTSPTHSLAFAFPKRSWMKSLCSTLAIAINNVTFYYSATLTRVYIRLERDASGLYNSLNSCFILPICIKNYFRRPETQNVPGGAYPLEPLWARSASIILCAPRLLNPPANFCLRSWEGCVAGTHPLDMKPRSIHNNYAFLPLLVLGMQCTSQVDPGGRSLAHT